MRATIQMIGLVSMLILGIFLGIDTAEKNMQKMQGTEGAPRAIQITPNNGKIEISVMGKVVQTENPVKKMEKIDPKKVEGVTKQVKEETNHLAAIGNEVGVGLRQATRTVVEMLFSWAR